MKKLEELVENDTAGDPMSSRKWSRISTYTLSQELCTKNLIVSPTTIGDLLKKNLGYSLKSNRKTIAETQHPDRNQQFEIIAYFKKLFAHNGQPIISADSKKKELIGNFCNSGQIWCKEAEKVFNHDFRSMADGIASPYGIMDIISNLGTVIVGTSYDTPQFAVDSIELWLNSSGWKFYPNMKELLILCDAGGSNSYRARLWKSGIYKSLCQKYGISVTVCHYPSGASKWNPTDHRLFSFITANWAGRPLRSYEIMLNYIRNTTNKKGLKVEGILNEKKYEKGIKIDDNQFNEINIYRNKHLPQWNYTIRP